MILAVAAFMTGHFGETLRRRLLSVVLCYLNENHSGSVLWFGAPAENKIDSYFFFPPGLSLVLSANTVNLPFLVTILFFLYIFIGLDREI